MRSPSLPTRGRERPRVAFLSANSGIWELVSMFIVENIAKRSEDAHAPVGLPASPSTLSSGPGLGFKLNLEDCLSKLG